MNTVKKGNEFENLCFNIISNALQKDELGIIPRYCRVFQKKGYYSNDRQSNIIFDLSIELWLPEANTFSLLYIIECKDYSTPVPVNDLEEFYTKVRQVSGLNIKGVFITSNTFQKGAYTFAQSGKMMLIEINENITYNIVLYKAQRYNQNLSESRMIVDGTNEIPVYNSEISRQKNIRLLDKILISTFVKHVKNNMPNIKKKKIPILSTENIEEITYQLISLFDSNILRFKRNLSIDKYEKYLNRVYDLSIIDYDFSETDIDGNKIKSSCSFVEKCIKIDKSLRKTRNYKFIVAHEIGHFFLHNKLQIDQHSYDQLKDSEYNFALDRYILLNDKNWIEWQANQFASSIIMSKNSIENRFFEAQDKNGLKPGNPLYVDDQPCNQETFHKIIAELSIFFQTTKTSIIYRLNGLGYINEQYNVRSVGQILNEMFDIYE